METTHHPRRILLAVTGLSPQIVTETLYALAVRDRDAWIPTEIHLLTTAEGAERARLSLPSDHPGWFRRLLSDYDLPDIRFDRDHIHILLGADGQPLPDIRTDTDSRLAADQICALVSRYSADPQTQLHVSIAGGRKTMGYYLGYALSLFGRAQDRLSHVLVSEPFESSWDFFYPSPVSRVMTTRDNKLIDAADAQVTLADIPFIRVREGLPTRLLDGTASFVETVDTAQRALAPPALQIDLAAQCIHAAGERIDLPPA
ncbi:CRISPR-associated ring nuclease Csm6 [Thiorhodococcus mannitoliphagus]|uniref:CRISPR-associated ring nuclease Csm6 n=1 Tax=Thiorhodococcus mannitoliphagus TaxID=329406 RepID=UPI001F0E4BAF|nr:CRISPR-associated ring nuclease Csm6 [Thiorhodococcus mannitoliphagus]